MSLDPLASIEEVHYPIKIYKQRIINSFIADFYCHAARLAIETDANLRSWPMMQSARPYWKSMG